MLKSGITSVECLLLGQQCLNGGEIASEVFRTDVIFLVGDPRFNDVGLPHELEVGSIVQQTTLPTPGDRTQSIQLVLRRVI